MANIKSAKKRIRVIDKKTARNKRVKNHLKESLKAFDIALEAVSYTHLDVYKRQPYRPLGICPG